MTTKTIVSILLFIAGIIGGKYVYDTLFGQSEIASFEDSDWTRTECLGVRFEVPFELSDMDLDLPESVRQYIKVMNNYQYESKSISLFISNAEYNTGVKANIDGAVNGAVRSMEAQKGVSDFTYTVKNIEKNSIEGRLIEGTCKIKGLNAEFVGEIYLRNLKLLQILAMNLSHTENREVRDRIMKSMKVTL